jgi:hypothetical protein
MEFAITRFYPVDQTNKIVYLDTQQRKEHCSQSMFPNATGLSGFQLKHEWEQMLAQGYTTKRVSKERRGGAGRGQGRPFLDTPISTVKLKIPQLVHLKLQEQVVTFRKRSGHYVSLQDYTAQLIMQADINLLMPMVKALKSKPPAWLHLPEAANDRLQQLTNQVAAVHPELQTSRPMVLGAIVALANE